MICNKCGNAVDHAAYFCEQCGNRVRKEVVQIDKSQLRGMDLWEENYIFGVIAALLGSAAGIVIFYQWYMFFGTQFLAPVPGFILGVLTAGGYWWLGKRLRRIGVTICILLVLLSGWLSNQIFWAMVVYTNQIIPGITFSEAFLQLDRFLHNGYLDQVYYALGIIGIYFGALVGVGIVAAFHKTLVKD